MAEQGSEKVYFSESDVVVTYSRINMRGDMYSLPNVSSSKVRYSNVVDKKKKILRSCAILVSILLGIPISINGNILGIILAVAGIVASLIFIKIKYKLYSLYLGISSGEHEAIHSRDSSFIDRINTAINDAMIDRK